MTKEVEQHPTKERSGDERSETTPSDPYHHASPINHNVEQPATVQQLAAQPMTIATAIQSTT